MGWYTAQPGDVITAARFNNNTIDVFTGVAGFEEQVTLADNVAATLLFLPTTDPVAPVELIQIKQQLSGNRMMAFRSDGMAILAGTINGTLTIQPSAGIAPAAATELIQLNSIAGSRLVAFRYDGGMIMAAGVATMNGIFAQAAATMGSTVNIVGLTTLQGLIAQAAASFNSTTNHVGLATFSTLLATGAATFASTLTVVGTLTAALPAALGTPTGAGVIGFSGVTLNYGDGSANQVLANIAGSQHITGFKTIESPTIITPTLTSPILTAPNAVLTSPGDLPVLFGSVSSDGTKTILNFPAISAGWGHIRIVGVAALNNSDHVLGLTFNADSGTHYDYIVNNATSATNQTSGYIASLADQGGTGFNAPGWVSSFTIDIPLYANTTFYKTAIVNAQEYNNQTLALHSILSVITWKSTAAITSITLNAIGTMVSISEASLYLYP